MNLNDRGPDGHRTDNRKYDGLTVMKGEGPFAKQNAEAREILWRNRINPFTGRENLVWAPSWKHSKEYADFVLMRLRKADGDGRAAVVTALEEIALRFIAGNLGTEDDPENE